jgi:hypothetical protein
MDKDIINWPKFTVVLPILLFLLSGIPNVSSQQNPYAPEIDYSCVDLTNNGLEVQSEYQYGFLKCSIRNNNPHDVTVKISEEWEHNVDGPYEENTDSSYYCGNENEIGREINVLASSTVVFCYKISAHKYAAEGISILTSTAEVVRYSTVIPCDICEPVDEEVEIEIFPWIRVSYDYVSVPESAYGYNSDRTICDKSDFSELILEISVDGNFLGTEDLFVAFTPRWTIRDLVEDGYVEYRESTFGKIKLEYDSELSLKAGETVQRTFKASWDVKEDTDNYDITLATYIEISATSSYYYRGLSLYDECPTWEGVLPTQEIKSNNDSSGITVNLNSPFSISLSVISILMAAVIIRKD